MQERMPRHLQPCCTGHGSPAARRPAQRRCSSSRVLRARTASQRSSVEAIETSDSKHSSWRSLLVGFSAAVLAGTCTICPSAVQALQVPYLQSAVGARGPIAAEEARLLRLRQEAEGPVREELQRARTELEAEGRLTQFGKLCATPFGVDVVGITELVALTGALVGGVTARQRKRELEVLNEQLRKINLNLRQQARASTIYTPGLNFAVRDQPPSPSSHSNGHTVQAGSTAAVATVASPSSSVLATVDEEDQSFEVRQCVAALREGKRLLREKQGASAMVRFEKALMLAKGSKEAIYERRSVRGLAASARLQGQYKAAIQHLERVLEISQSMGDHVGDADAYGTIADIYTDMGQFEKAAKYYDQYIETMNSDGPV